MTGSENDCCDQNRHLYRRARRRTCRPASRHPTQTSSVMNPQRRSTSSVTTSAIRTGFLLKHCPTSMLSKRPLFRSVVPFMYPIFLSVAHEGHHPIASQWHCERASRLHRHQQTPRPPRRLVAGTVSFTVSLLTQTVDAATQQGTLRASQANWPLESESIEEDDG